MSQLINETLAEASSNISQLVDAKSDIQVEAEREQKQFKFTGSPRTNSYTPKSNHFTSALRTVEYQTHLHLQETESQQGSRAVQREVRAAFMREEAGFLDN